MARGQLRASGMGRGRNSHRSKAGELKLLRRGKDGGGSSRLARWSASSRPLPNGRGTVMLKELKERRSMQRLPIAEFAEACNEVLTQLNQAREKASRVTPRTIRYYTQEGLLPAPTLEHGQARYGYEHLLRVLAIKLYQTQFIPLRLIRQRLAGQGKAALERFVTDAVLDRNGVLPVDGIAASTPTREEPMMSTGQSLSMILPEVPPQVPINPLEATRPILPPVPVVYE